MYILAIDTSGKEGSVALARGDQGSFEVPESRSLAGGMYSAELMPQIAAMLAVRELEKQAVDLYVVCSGPGSFTGLRVGLSCVKGLAEVLGKPIVAMTVLEAISALVRETRSELRMVVPVLDAQRGEVFAGNYDTSGELPVRISETLTPLTEFVGSNASMVFSPDAALEAKLVEAGCSVQHVVRPSAGDYARLGLRKFLAGITVSAEELDADYIRRSDAEIFSAPKPR